MIVYFDTSALVKRYIREDWTDEVDGLWASSSDVATSVVAFAETVAAFGRKLREGVLTEREHAAALKTFKSDFRSLILVPVTTELNATIERLVRRHPLRGFDAIHLSSALVFKNAGGIPVRFACYDSALNEAAAKEGLRAALGL